VADAPELTRPATREPALDYPDYRSTALRHPQQPLVHLPEQVTETTGPQLGELRAGAINNDLTTQHEGEPTGSGSPSPAGCSIRTTGRSATR